MFAVTPIFRLFLPLGLVTLLLMVSACSNPSDDALDISHNQQALLTASEKSRAEIESVIFDKYLLGQKMKSADVIQQAFNQDSVMLYPYKDDEGDSRLKRWLNMHETVAGWAEQSSADLDLTQFEILSMDIVDNRMATVILKVQERVFDAITLVREGDDWKIASKVYIKQKN